MDNFRNFDSKKTRKKAMDGFIVGGSMPQRKTFSKSQLIQPPAGSNLGNFRARDGFHPNAQSEMKTTARPVGRQPHRDAVTGHIALDMPKVSAMPKNKIHKRSRRKLILRSLLAIFIVGILGTGFFFGKGYLKAKQIFKGGGNSAALQENVDPSKLKGEGDGRVNILLLGKGGVGHEAPDLTDTILVVSIDPLQKEAALLSIPRDMYVKTTDYGSMKINAVYASAKNEVLGGKKITDQAKKAEDAGFSAIEKTIQQSIGIPINYHVMVDFSGFKKAIDTVGGIDMNVTTSVVERMSIDGKPYFLSVQTGQQHFDGFRALAYSRSRYTSARGDFDRSERQRAVLVALKDKVLSAGTLGNPVKLSQLMDNFGNNISTNLSIDELLRVYEIGKQIDNSKIQSIGLADPPNNYLTTGMLDGQSVVIPRAGLNNYKEIQNFIRNRLKDGYLVNENATVAVYNGTYTAGLAARTAEELKSFGYNISTVADAPTKGYKDTVIIDLRNGSKKYTRRYLEQRFKTLMLSNLPDTSIVPGTADFVIILGENEISRLEN